MSTKKSENIIVNNSTILNNNTNLLHNLVITKEDIHSKKSFKNITDEIKNLYFEKICKNFENIKFIYLPFFISLILSIFMPFLEKYLENTVFFFIWLFTFCTVFFSVFFISRSLFKLLSGLSNMTGDYLNYFLPLSSYEISKRISDNKYLKNIILNKIKNKEFISQFIIDKCQGKNKYEKHKFKINDYFKSEVDLEEASSIIHNEQSKVFNMDVTDNKYKVEYKIKNGPLYNAIFEYPTCDESIFKDYLEKECIEQYDRGCKIMSITKID